MKRRFVLTTLAFLIILLAGSMSSSACIGGGWAIGCGGVPGYNQCYSRAQSFYNSCYNRCAAEAGSNLDQRDSCARNECQTVRECDEADCRDFYCNVGCSPADPLWPYC